jgi:HAT1-interacting factor 1
LNPLLAETYARYGSLLLRVAIKNNDQNVLSSANAATAGTAETTEALLKVASGDKKKIIEFSGDEDEEDVNDEKDGEINNVISNNDPEQESGERIGAVAEEEEDDFTIAWENLDVARLLFEKRIDACADDSEKLALNRALGFVYQDLGDLSLENGN